MKLTVGLKRKLTQSVIMACSRWHLKDNWFFDEWRRMTHIRHARVAGPDSGDVTDALLFLGRAHTRHLFTHFSYSFYRGRCFEVSPRWKEQFFSTHIVPAELAFIGFHAFSSLERPYIPYVGSTGWRFRKRVYGNHCNTVACTCAREYEYVRFNNVIGKWIRHMHRCSQLTNWTN